MSLDEVINFVTLQDLGIHRVCWHQPTAWGWGGGFPAARVRAMRVRLRGAFAGVLAAVCCGALLTQGWRARESRVSLSFSLPLPPSLSLSLSLALCLSLSLSLSCVCVCVCVRCVRAMRVCARQKRTRLRAHTGSKNRFSTFFLVIHVL